MSDYLSRLVTRTLLAPEIRPRLQPLYGSANSEGLEEIAQYAETAEPAGMPLTPFTAGQVYADQIYAHPSSTEKVPANPAPEDKARAGTEGIGAMPADEGAADAAPRTVVRPTPLPIMESPVEGRLNPEPAVFLEMHSGTRAASAEASAIHSDSPPAGPLPPMDAAFPVAARAGLTAAATQPPRHEIPETGKSRNVPERLVQQPAGSSANAATTLRREPADWVKRGATPVPDPDANGPVKRTARVAPHASIGSVAPRPAPVEPWPTRRRAAPTPSLPVTAPDDAGEPTIQVTIGRLEIRAAMAPATAPARLPGVVQKQTSLEEYLRSRAKGSRS